MMRLLRLLLLATLSVSALAPVTTIHAQDSSKPFLRITDINVENFPNIDVFVFGENLNVNLGTIDMVLEEDRAVQPIIDSSFVDVGIQTAIVLDASRNILSPGNTGDPRHIEVANAASRFVQLGVLSAQTDWLGAYTTGSSQGEFQTIADWQQDHQAVVNALLQYEPPGVLINTALFGLIKFTLDKIENAPVPTNLRRSMVVFSDGTDIVSNVEVDDIVRRATQMDVRIHTVLLGVPTRDSRRNLGRLADVTGGMFIQLNSIDDVEPLWQSLAAERTQRILRYRLSQAQPDELQVTVAMPDGSTLSHTKEYPVVGARPVEIQVLLPSGNAPIARAASTHDTPLEQMEPTQLQIEVEFIWPDGHPRSFRRVEYGLDSDTRLQTQEPFNTYTYPIANLTPGYHTLRVLAVDELGLTGTAAPVSFQIVIQRPDEPRAVQNLTGSVTSTIAGITKTGFNIDDLLPTNTTFITKSESVSGVVLLDSATSAPGSGTEGGDGPGFSLFGVTLPPNISVGNRTIPINTTTLLITAFPLVFLMFLLIYWGRRSRTPTDPFALSPEPYHEVGFEEQSSVTVPAVTAFDVDDDATEPVRLLKFAASAYLIYEEGGAHLPKEFALEDGREIRIGRRSNLCDIVIDDKRISRQHATIEGKTDGFYIRDDGSAGGTYVNRRRLGVSDNRKLKHGDIINFNEVAYRFKRTAEDEDATIPASEADLPFDSKNR